MKYQVRNSTANDGCRRCLIQAACSGQWYTFLSGLKCFVKLFFFQFTCLSFFYTGFTMDSIKVFLKEPYLKNLIELKYHLNLFSLHPL